MKRSELLFEIIKNLIHIKRFHIVEEDVYFKGPTYKLHILPYETPRFFSNVELYKRDEEGRYPILCNVISANRKQKFKGDFTIDIQLSIYHNYENDSFRLQNNYKVIDELEILDIKDEDYESKLFQLMLVQNHDIHDVYEIVSKTCPLLQNNMEVHCRDSILAMDCSELEIILEELKNFVLDNIEITIEEANES